MEQGQKEREDLMRNPGGGQHEYGGCSQGVDNGCFVEEWEVCQRRNGWMLLGCWVGVFGWMRRCGVLFLTPGVFLLV